MSPHSQISPLTGIEGMRLLTSESMFDTMLVRESADLAVQKGCHITPPLPNNINIRRCTNVYSLHFHPYRLILHVPVISFGTSSYTYPLRASHNHNGDAVVCGGSCLILAMVALNPMCNSEQIVERDLLGATKKSMLDYLDECRKARPSAAFNKSSAANEFIKKPTLWIVQAYTYPTEFDAHSVTGVARNQSSTLHIS
jgi:hypothetical protein